MNAADVMTRNPATVREDTPIAEAIHLMLDRRISGMPVSGANGELVGILTEGDLLRRIETGTERQRPRWIEFLMGSGRLAAEYVRTHARRVNEVMTRGVASVTPDTPLRDVVALMERRGVKRIPVVQNETCIGIISRADLIRTLGRVLDAEPTSASDEAIREHVLREINSRPWAATTSVEVTVNDGVVDLDGVVFDERERTALKVAAETAPGIRGIQDHLTWIEPNTGITFPAP